MNGAKKEKKQIKEKVYTRVRAIELEKWEP